MKDQPHQENDKHRLCELQHDRIGSRRELGRRHKGKRHHRIAHRTEEHRLIPHKLLAAQKHVTSHNQHRENTARSLDRHRRPRNRLD